MSRRFCVCLVVEGSYPYVTGGVGGWVHDLITGLPELDFVLLTISPEEGQPYRYVLPSNVRIHQDLVLSSPPAKKNKSTSVPKLAKEVIASHEAAFHGGPMDLEKTVKSMPEGYSFHRDALSRDDLWRLIVDRNTEKNPLYPFSDFLWSWRSSHEMLFRILETAPPDADLYHSVSTGFAGLATLAAKWRRGVPMILTEHGLYHRERDMEIRKATFVKGYQRDHWTSLYHQLSRICYREADACTALFEANRQEQVSLGALPARTRVIPNGIDLEKYSSVVRVARPGFHVGLVGRVVPIKDIKTFIITAKLLRSTLEDVQFHCVGPTEEDPSYFLECEELVESLGLGECFTFTGRQDVTQYYSFLDVLLLTSIREAQPLSILEAWSASVPVVATKVGNVPEMMDYDERFLSDPKDAETLAQRVLWVRHNAVERDKAMESFRRKVARLHDQKTVLQTYKALYAEIGGTRWPG